MRKGDKGEREWERVRGVGVKRGEERKREETEGEKGERQCGRE